MKIMSIIPRQHLLQKQKVEYQDQKVLIIVTPRISLLQQLLLVVTR